MGKVEKYEGLTKEQKRRSVIREGREVQYLTCPLCGFNRPVIKYLKGRIKLTNIDLDRMFVLVTRAGGGRESGFYRIDSKSILLKDLKDKAKYRDLVSQIRIQSKRILDVLK